MVGEGDRANHRESQPQALAPLLRAAPERFEEGGDLSGVQGRAGVDDLDEGEPLVDAGRHRRRPARMIVAYSVGQQVQRKAPEQGGVTRDRCRSEVRGDADVCGPGLIGSSMAFPATSVRSTGCDVRLSFSPRARVGSVSMRRSVRALASSARRRAGSRSEGTRPCARGISNAVRLHDRCRSRGLRSGSRRRLRLSGTARGPGVPDGRPAFRGRRHRWTVD